MATGAEIYVHADTGRTGLGNMLFSWARAEVLALRHGWTLLASRWVKPKIGPLLRGERDKRYYIGSFSSDGRIDGWRRRLLLWTAARVSEDDSAAIARLAGSGAIRPTVVVTRGMDGLFAPLLEHRDHVARRFHGMLSPRLRESLGPVERAYVAVHVRRSDFKDPGPSGAPGADASNTRIPDSWYIRCIEQVRAALPELPVRIFSDAHPHELEGILAVSGTSLAPAAPAPADLVRLSRAALLIGSSGSTFSMWAAFLGSCPVVMASEPCAQAAVRRCPARMHHR